MNEPVKIDPEFQSLIPPLSAEEFQQLTENCRRDGILDSLKVWNGILIDGHNRFKIAEEWNLNYQVEEMDFPDREAVIRWIILNQFGRRNLSRYVRSVLALKLKPVIAEQKEKNLHLSEGAGNKGTQKSADVSKGETRRDIAKIAGVSHDTIRKVETIEQKASEPLKEQVKTGQKTINQAWLEIKEKERKQADFSARAALEEAEERHRDFKASTDKAVSINRIEQDKRDVARIAEGQMRKIENAIKPILFIRATTSGGDMNFSAVNSKNIHPDTLKRLLVDIDKSIDTLSRIKNSIQGR